MKTKFFAKLFIIFSLICNTLAFSLPTFATSFNMTSSVKQVAPGDTFSVSVGGDCIGRVNIKVVGGTATQTAVWVEENYQTVTITAGNSGTVTVTATPETGFSDSDANEYKPGARTTSVNIVAPSQPTETKPNTNQPNTSTNNTSTSKPTTNQDSTTKPTNTNSEPTTKPEDDANVETENKTEPETPSEDTDAEVIDEVIDPTEESEVIPSDPCTKYATSNTIAWIIAGIFALLFLGTFIALIYLLSKRDTQAKPADKPKSKTSAKSHETSH